MLFTLSYLQKLYTASQKSDGALLAVLQTEDLIITVNNARINDMDLTRGVAHYSRKKS
jgi:hypothetical protein